VDRGNTCGTGVEIAAILPLAVLCEAVRELDFGAFADGPAATTGAVAGFEDGAVKARFTEFVGSGHAGDACAKDDHFFPFAEVRRKLWERRLSDGRHDAEGLHGGKCSGVAADLGDTLDEDTSGQAHCDGSDGL
jgi:hypothetical protein